MPAPIMCFTPLRRRSCTIRPWRSTFWHAFVQSLRKSPSGFPFRWKMYGQSSRRTASRRSTTRAISPAPVLRLAVLTAEPDHPVRAVVVPPFERAHLADPPRGEEGEEDGVRDVGWQVVAHLLYFFSAQVSLSDAARICGQLGEERRRSQLSGSY